MIRKTLLSFLVLAVTVVFAIPSAKAAEAPNNFSRISHAGKVIVDKPVELALVHKGVKLESISFSGNEVLVIVWNRTPKAVKGHIGIALFDSKGRLVAAESDAQSVTRAIASIRSGKQTGFKVRFKKFLSNFEGVTQYRLVFAIVE
ncbi:MAG: hypothetical protein OES46_01420 [Gammaproteobacteria bacterium]|jgi:hypothetical protein|nr:hypothetical protein [Gammaproteobacteria bacterium]